MAPFIFNGGNKTRSEPCHEFTCDIQSCLQKNGFKQEKCEYLVDKLYECCQGYYKRHPDVNNTMSCPEREILDAKIEHRKREKEDVS